METSDESDTDKADDMRESILKASLAFVSQHGWSTKTLAAGASKEGLPGVVHGMFPRGGVDLISYFYEDCNRRLEKLVSAEVLRREDIDVTEDPTPSITMYSLTARLRMILPYIDQWPEAMAIRLLPQNTAESAKQLMQLADDVAYYSGDKSVDMKWYWKRMALAGVFKSTEVHLIQDTSHDYADTWQFLQQRLDDMHNFAESCQNVSNFNRR